MNDEELLKEDYKEQSIYLKSLKDTSCRYLETSAKCFQDFIHAYNSGDYGRLNQSVADFYKAWDSLYQSMLIQWGKIIRKTDKEYPVLGKIVSITDFINTRSKNQTMSYYYLEIEEKRNKHGETEEIKHLKKDRNPLPYPPFKSWDSNEVIPPENLFHNLNLLRELRNASEHDFLERVDGSYNRLVTTLNPYLVPLVKEFIISYELFYETVHRECHKNRTVYCNKNNIPKPHYLESISHLPIPLEKDYSDNEKLFTPKLGAVVREYLKIYDTENKKCLVDHSLGVQNIRMNHLSSIIQKYKYSKLTSVLKAVNNERANNNKMPITDKQMRTFIKKEKLKDKIKYTLCLEIEGRLKYFYSVDLVDFLYKKADV